MNPHISDFGCAAGTDTCSHCLIEIALPILLAPAEKAQIAADSAPQKAIRTLVYGFEARLLFDQRIFDHSIHSVPLGQLRRTRVEVWASYVPFRLSNTNKDNSCAKKSRFYSL